MSDKNPYGNKILVCVAPASTGFQTLGDRVQKACSDLGIDVAQPIRLIGGEYRWSAIECDVDLKTLDMSVARQELEAALSSIADIALLPAENRRKKLLISDMDSTIIEQECLDELAAYAGLKDEIAAITARAMTGELNFEEALTERVSKLSGLSLEALEDCYRERISLMPGARTLTATMSGHGAHCILVSGGFTYFTERVAAAAGFADHQGNTLLDNGSALTGTVGMPILGREAKLTALQTAAAEKGLSIDQAITMGDGANDLAMIEAAGLGLAVHAKPVVAAASDAAINVTDLTAALYFQGYTDSEIIWRD